MNFRSLLLTNIGTTNSIITDITDRYGPIITSVVSMVLVVSVVTSVIPAGRLIVLLGGWLPAR